MKKDLIDITGEIIVETRNAGINTYLEIESKQWVPKNPDEQQKNVMKFVDSLTEEQKKVFKSTLGYFIDISFFKLIETLENGEGDINFKLTVLDETDEFELINDEQDNELATKYWEWLSKYGIKETTSW